MKSFKEFLSESRKGIRVFINQIKRVIGNQSHKFDFNIESDYELTISANNVEEYNPTTKVMSKIAQDIRNTIPGARTEVFETEHSSGVDVATISVTFPSLM